MNHQDKIIPSLQWTNREHDDVGRLHRVFCGKNDPGKRKKLADINPN